MVIVKVKTGEQAGWYINKGKGWYQGFTDQLSKARIYTNASYARRSVDNYKDKTYFDKNFEIVPLTVQEGQ